MVGIFYNVYLAVISEMGIGSDEISFPEFMIALEGFSDYEVR